MTGRHKLSDLEGSRPHILPVAETFPHLLVSVTPVVKITVNKGKKRVPIYNDTVYSDTYEDNTGLSRHKSS